MPLPVARTFAKKLKISPVNGQNFFKKSENFSSSQDFAVLSANVCVFASLSIKNPQVG
jgi:hypothetical protein